MGSIMGKKANADDSVGNQSPPFLLERALTVAAAQEMSRVWRFLKHKGTITMQYYIRSILGIYSQSIVSLITAVGLD